MMRVTVKDLKDEFQSIPDDAEIYLECDHGQNKESAGTVVFSRSPIQEYDDPDSMIFEWDNWREIYDKDCVDMYDEGGKITAVLISY